jgi:hypothetical protein
MAHLPGADETEKLNAVFEEFVLGPDRVQPQKHAAR